MSHAMLGVRKSPTPTAGISSTRMTAQGRKQEVAFPWMAGNCAQSSGNFPSNTGTWHPIHVLTSFFMVIVWLRNGYQEGACFFPACPLLPPKAQPVFVLPPPALLPECLFSLLPHIYLALISAVYFSLFHAPHPSPPSWVIKESLEKDGPASHTHPQCSKNLLRP